MLAFLRVKGFAIIDELDVEFQEGLNVITGETGAGKSIIINALSSLLNARAPADVIRASSEHAEIVGHCFRDGEEYILKRVISAQGRARAFVNDSPVTGKRLEEQGDALIQVYGQNESQQLLSKETYISVIDRFLGIQEERERLAERVRRLHQVSEDLDREKKEAENQGKEMDLLTYQLQEIERENIREGEEEEVRERLKVLKDAAKIKNSIESIEAGLYDDERSVYATLAAFGSLLRPFASIEWIERTRSRIEGLSLDVEDILSSLRDHKKALEYEPGELEELEDRLSSIVRLKEKYGKTHGSIKEFEQWARKRLEDLLHLKTDLEDLEEEKGLLESEVEAMAGRLSQARKKGAADIEKRVIDELRFLSMKGVQFRVTIADKGWIGEDGRDEVEFLLSTNPGEPLKPLRRVASGGELSRIMLAIKKITGGEEDKTFVFDEIDAGIGGRVAEVVGRRLRELSEKHQIICITHLPQIAAYGDHHFLVQKHQEKETTRTSIKELAGQERTAEVARMLGGITITAKTLEQAEEMLRNAQKSTD
ncbi:MAG: DNA repair protein RecN [Syntrophorhabdaceae bacterium PtaU1.Bin034]|nr:MAG: DNA repair protein RecN [Syntrophorhabdaceae bacterium PtaU1.Bin034]